MDQPPPTFPPASEEFIAMNQQTFPPNSIPQATEGGFLEGSTPITIPTDTPNPSNIPANSVQAEVNETAQKVVNEAEENAIAEAMVPPVQSKRFASIWRAVLTEYICTALFVFFAAGGAVNAQLFGESSFAANVVVALAQGFALTALIWSASHTSGGHLNPAVTITILIARKTEWWRCIAYVIAQILGGITGAALLLAVLPGEHKDKLGSTTLGSGESEFRAFLFEFIMTFALVFVVFATSMNHIKNPSFAPLPIGLTLASALLISWPYTGTSLNPARSFGPALVSDTWHNHWIYWVGPLAGGILGGSVYNYILLQPKERRDGRIYVEIWKRKQIHRLHHMHHLNTAFGIEPKHQPTHLNNHFRRQPNQSASGSANM